jgi:hypothetical protein
MTEGENMLERVARAIYHAKPRNKPYEQLGQHAQQYVKQARAVIEALMEPTPEMLVAGVDGYINFTMGDEHVYPEAAAAIFQAMLQSALRTASIPNEEGEGK